MHRLSIQAFYAILVDGKAIKIHPLVCQAFNADFDGDQMAVHIPISSLAIAEAKNLCLSVKNILSSSNGRPITVPSQDMVLGLHYLTKVRCGVKGEGIVFASADEVLSAYNFGQVDLHARIKVRLDSDIIETTAGRVIFYQVLPKGFPFERVNRLWPRATWQSL